MKIWKPLSKYWYSKERNEYKYHTDFALEEGESIEIKVNGKRLIKDETPKGKIFKIHFEMAVETFKEEENGR